MHDLTSCYIKSCSHPARYSQYADEFRTELAHMKHLYDLMEREGLGQLYERLFPRYESLSTEPDGRPLLVMENVFGKTLETYLCEQTAAGGPAVLFGSSRLLHIFEQLHDAVYWLHRGGMLHFDLSPQNILIVSDAFDLRFVDFTGCYHTALSVSENMRTGYKKMDYRTDPDASLSCQLRDTCALFFTRLFFCGNRHYNNAFSTNLQSRTGIRAFRFFDKKYPHLLDCLFYPSSSPHHTDGSLLSDWESWYQSLQKLLRSPFL